MKLTSLSSALVLFSSLYVAGCALAGQRVNGGCPAGETCSSQTPDGLFFVGKQAGDNIFGGGFPATAKGGTQTITVLTGQNADSPTFNGLFDAKSGNTTVFTVDAAEPPTVKVHGKADGSTFLRLVEPGTNNLLDRVTTQVESIDNVSLFPVDLVLASDKEISDWAILKGSKASIVVQLRAKNSDRLVDEGLALKATAGTATSTGWDTFDVTPPESGDAAFTISAGGASFETKAKVVDKIDAIDQSTLLGSSTTPAHVATGADLILCFVARSSGVATVGATWKYTPTAGLTLPSDSNKNLDQSSCIDLHGQTAGNEKLTVEAGGVSLTIDITVDAKTAGSLMRFPKHEPTPAAGERASGGEE